MFKIAVIWETIQVKRKAGSIDPAFLFGVGVLTKESKHLPLSPLGWDIVGTALSQASNTLRILRG